MVTTVQDLKTQSHGTKISQLKPKEQVKALLEQNRGLIKQALPKHINADRLLRVAQTSVTTTPGLLECYVPSLIGGIIQCAQMGLEPNTVLGHAYLIPFWNSQKRRKDAQVIIGYKGLIDLARRSGQIVSIAAHSVCEYDEFDFEYGLTERLSHKPNMTGERGAIIAFYAVAHMKDGGHAFEVMSRQQIERVRDDNAKNKKTGKVNAVWMNHFEEMGRKTVIRRLAKYLPLSVEFATGAAMDEAAENGEEQNLESALSGGYQVMPNDAPETEPTPSVDSFGEVYDQALHATNADGQPVLKSDGSFRKRRQPTRSAGTAAREDSGVTQEEKVSLTEITKAEVLRSLRSSETRMELDEASELIKELPEEDRGDCTEAYAERASIMEE